MTTKNLSNGVEILSDDDVPRGTSKRPIIDPDNLPKGTPHNGKTPTKTPVKISDIVAKAKDKFLEISEIHGDVNFETEGMFAMQQLDKSDFMRKTALSNPKSARDAVINVAAMGITLNPALGFAYLVPRGGEVCLDVSYKGLIQIATDTGSVLYVQADVVYESDVFVYKGKMDKPEHSADVFADRGAIVGVYCVAKTIEGDYLTEIMTLAEIHEIRACSKDWQKRKQKSIWGKWFNEYAKKSVIKRASKTWPKSDKSNRLYDAIHTDNQDYTEKPVEIDVTPQEFITEEMAAVFSEFLEANEIDKAGVSAWLKKSLGIDSFLEIPLSRLEGVYKKLNTRLEARNNDA